ncbi:energy transducer TonB [Moellerella wisconsensis]|uniref:energy transducer TonB n=1 Tax=Moellerella wisconsensis TaxID=158849 RepID=UPI001F4EF582|nr:energy transducer TonB [Moellerella wisconsensis]UNH27277.1 energy transducer TonB [Moellerella wisconsensis]
MKNTILTNTDLKKAMLQFCTHHYISSSFFSPKLLLWGLLAITLHITIFGVFFITPTSKRIDSPMQQGIQSPITSILLLAQSLVPIEKEVTDIDISIPLSPVNGTYNFSPQKAVIKKKLDDKKKPIKQPKKMPPKKDSKQQLAGSNEISTISGNTIPGKENIQGHQGSTANSYISKLKSEIEKHKQYPRKARRLRYQGKVMIEMTVANNGSLSNINVAKSSGYELLDKAAIDAVYKYRSIGDKPAEVKDILSFNMVFSLD